MKPRPSLDCDHDRLQEILDHGEIIEQDGDIKRWVHGPKSMVAIGKIIHSYYDRDRINEIERRSFDEFTKTGHFKDRMEDRNFSDEDIESIVEDGILYYADDWTYAKEIDGVPARVIVDKDYLVTVVWSGDNPRERDPTNAYFERREKRKV